MVSKHQSESNTQGRKQLCLTTRKNNRKATWRTQDQTQGGVNSFKEKTILERLEKKTKTI